MRILLINHYAGTPQRGMEFRPFYFGREWVRAGHETTVLAASQSHVRAKNPDVRGLWLEETLEGVRYRWLRTPRYRGNGFGRILNMLAFLVWLVVLAPFEALRRPAVVIASSTYPLDVFPAWLIARLCGAKLVYEVHDLWPLSPVELGGMSAGHPFVRLMQVGENFAYRHCDVCVSLLPAALEHMKAHGLAENKFRYVPNGVDLSEWEEGREALPDGHREALAELRARKGLLLGYLGTHGLANALHTLLHAAVRLKDEPIGVVLVGGGPDKEALVRQAEELGLGGSVLFLPPVGKRQVPAALAELDVLYIGLQQQPLFRFGISPNKIFDYMMAARPIVNGIEAGNDPVAEAGCGRSVPSEDPEALAAAVRELAALDPADRAALGERGREFVRSRHQIRNLAAEMLAGTGATA